MEGKSFIAACKDYFGLLPGQKLMEFGAEVKKLTYESRMEIHAGLAKLGIICSEPAKS